MHDNRCRPCSGSLYPLYRANLFEIPHQEVCACRLAGFPVNVQGSHHDNPGSLRLQMVFADLPLSHAVSEGSGLPEQRYGTAGMSALPDLLVLQSSVPGRKRGISNIMQSASCEDES